MQLSGVVLISDGYGLPCQKIRHFTSQFPYQRRQIDSLGLKRCIWLMIQPEQRFSSEMLVCVRTGAVYTDRRCFARPLTFLAFPVTSVSFDVRADGADRCPEFMAGVPEKTPLTVYRLLNRGETVADKLRHFIQLWIRKIRHRIREFVVVEGMSPGAQRCHGARHVPQEQPANDRKLANQSPVY